MAVTTLQQAIQPGMSASGYDSQLQLALQTWQAIQANVALTDTASAAAQVDVNVVMEGDANSDTIVSDAAAAIALLQAEIARIGG